MVRSIKILGLRFTLEPHPISEVPQSRAQHVAYVGFAGTDNIKAATWKNGGWLDHRSQPFTEPPVQWFSLEGPHGNA